MLILILRLALQDGDFHYLPFVEEIKVQTSFVTSLKNTSPNVTNWNLKPTPGNRIHTLTHLILLSKMHRKVKSVQRHESRIFLKQLCF